MKLTNEFHTIREWAAERGINKVPINSQFDKLIEEVQELFDGIKKDDIEEIKDAIGDCVIVLTNLAAIAGPTIEDCINHAYNQIKNRTGKIVDGQFVKDK